MRRTQITTSAGVYQTLAPYDDVRLALETDAPVIHVRKPDDTWVTLRTSAVLAVDEVYARPVGYVAAEQRYVMERVEEALADRAAVEAAHDYALAG